MQFSLAYSSHRHKHAALSASIFPESARPPHGVATPRTIKVLCAYSCNNHSSLALKLHPPTPTPPIKTHSDWFRPDTYWIFHHLMKTVRAFLLSCCVSNCQLPSYSPASLQPPWFVLTQYHTHAACTARSEHWHCRYTFRVLLGGLALWIFNRRSITGAALCSYRWVNSGVRIKCVARCLVSYRKLITERDSTINQ